MPRCLRRPGAQHPVRSLVFDVGSLRPARARPGGVHDPPGRGRAFTPGRRRRGSRDFHLDAPGPGALINALPGALSPPGGSRLQPKNLLESLRDRVVHRSQIGKRKLDRAATQRDLDKALRDLGERYRALVRSGRVDVPDDLSREMEEVRRLEEKVEAEDGEIAALEGEHPSRK